MESLNTLFECTICFQSYDADFHVPLILSCGHNICSSSVEKLYNNTILKCPICRQNNVYQDIDDISPNFSLI